MEGIQETAERSVLNHRDAASIRPDCPKHENAGRAEQCGKVRSEDPLDQETARDDYYHRENEICAGGNFLIELFFSMPRSATCH